MKQIYVESYYKNGYSRFMQYSYNIINHPKRGYIERRIKNFIIDYRTSYLGADKVTIAFALAAACTCASIEPISASTEEENPQK